MGARTAPLTGMRKTAVRITLRLFTFNQTSYIKISAETDTPNGLIRLKITTFKYIFKLAQ